MSAAHLDVYTNKTAGTGVGNLSVTLTGADVRVGDRIAIVACADGNSAQDDVRYDSDTGDSAGFTLIGSSTQSCTVYAFHKHAMPRDEGEPTYNFKIASGTEKMVVSVLHIRGDDGLDGTPAFLQNVLDSTPDSPSVTTSEDDALVYHFLGIKTAGGTVTTPPSGETLVFDDADGGGGGIRFACYRTTQASAGATGAEGWVIDTANDSIGFTIAFKLGELQRDYAPAASGAKKVYIEGYASKVGGSGTHTGHPLLITDSVLKTNNLNMFDSGHADAATEGSIRFSLDEAGAEPLPGQVHFVSDEIAAFGQLEAYTRRPTNDGGSDSGNGVYMWWIPGSAKTQPAAGAQHGSKSVQPHSYRLNIIGGGYTDETVHGNDATGTNTTLSTDVPFGWLESIDFNGASSRLNILDDDSLDLADGESLTMLSWMVVDSDTGGFQGFMSKRQGLSHNYGAFYIADDGVDNGTFHANLYNGGFRGVTMDFNPNFSKSTWMPIFVEFEDVGTDYTKRIFNGTTLVNQATDAFEPITNGHDLIVGATKTGSGTYGEWADGRRKGQRIIFEILSADVKTTIVNNESDNAAFWNAQWTYTAGDGDGKGSTGVELSGTSSTAVAASGSIQLTKRLSASSSAAAAGSGSIQLTKRLSGASSTAVAGSGRAKVTRNLSGASSVVVASSGSVQTTTPGSVELSGASSTAIAASGRVRLTKRLSGASSVVVAASGSVLSGSAPVKSNIVVRDKYRIRATLSEVIS